MRNLAIGLLFAIALALSCVLLAAINKHEVENDRLKIENLEQENTRLKYIVRCQNDTILKAKERLNNAIYQ